MLTNHFQNNFTSINPADIEEASYVVEGRVSNDMNVELDMDYIEEKNH